MEKQLLMILFFVMLLSSCVDLGSRNVWKDGKFYVTDNPADPNCLTLYLEIDENSGHGRVDYVKKIGSNKDYIIVFSQYNSGNSIEEYWILDKKKDNHFLNSEEIMEAPLTKNEFERKKKLLGISDIEFEDEFD